MPWSKMVSCALYSRECLLWITPLTFIQMLLMSVSQKIIH
nr:hypothetical protein [Escherichia coli]